MLLLYLLLLNPNFTDHGKHTEFLTDDTAVDNRVSYPPAIVPQMVEGNGEAFCLGLPLSCLH